MAAEGTDIDGTLDGWRAQGADRRDPIRFQRIVALQRRAATHDGAVRSALDARLQALMAAYPMPSAAARDDSGDDGTAGLERSGDSPLGALVSALHRHAATRADAGTTDAFAVPVDYPELAALDDFRQLWATLRTGSQVRQSLAQAPTGAGPLNSAALVHRALILMRGLSPDYLRTFLAYADTLSWLETLQDAGVLTGKEATPTASGKPRAKARPRKRRA